MSPRRPSQIHSPNSELVFIYILQSHSMDLYMFMFADVASFELIVSKPYLDMFISNAYRALDFLFRVYNLRSLVYLQYSYIRKMIWISVYLANSELAILQRHSMDLYMLMFMEVVSFELIISKPSSKYLME
jgi:hypothetical protein